jgi:hypothetical protein
VLRCDFVILCDDFFAAGKPNAGSALATVSNRRFKKSSEL